MLCLLKKPPATEWIGSGISEVPDLRWRWDTGHSGMASSRLSWVLCPWLCCVGRAQLQGAACASAPAASAPGCLPLGSGWPDSAFCSLGLSTFSPFQSFRARAAHGWKCSTVLVGKGFGQELATWRLKYPRPCHGWGCKKPRLAGKVGLPAQGHGAPFSGKGSTLQLFGQLDQGPL